MKDYEQLYYDLLYENKKLKKKILELESDLQLINSNMLDKLNISKVILDSLKEYKVKRKGDSNER